MTVARDAASCVLAAAVTAILALRWDEGRITALRAANAELAARIEDAAASRLAEERALRRERAVFARMAGAVSARSASERQAHFLRAAAALFATHRVTAASIAAGREAERAGRVPLDLALEGGYADLLAVVRRLSSVASPVSVEILSLARANGAQRVRAQVHVIFEDLRPPADVHPFGA